MTVTNTMTILLDDLTLVMDHVLETVGQICTIIVGQPVLLLTMGIMLLGGAIGIFGRLLSRG